MTYDQESRLIRALESIASSLEKLANPPLPAFGPVDMDASRRSFFGGTVKFTENKNG